MRHYISTLPVIWSFMKFCVARTFWVERQDSLSKNIKMIALLMTEISNFTTIEEKKEF